MAKKIQRMLTSESSVRSISLKFYFEQIPDGENVLYDTIRGIDKGKYHVLAIKHDKDTVGDDFWEPSVEKPHFHIIARSSNNSPTKLGTVLNMFGVVFRKGLDDVLLAHHGAETVRNFANMAVYLTHDTEDAILDGKYQYQISDIVSNLTEDEIMRVRDGYIRLHDIGKVSDSDMAVLDKEARQLGYDLKDFDEWYGSLPYKVRSNCHIKTIKESYELGVSERMETGINLDVPRLCIFIRGEANLGKTYASKASVIGLKIREVVKGSGRYDDIRLSDDVLIADDVEMANILNMCDNRICRARKRCKGSPIWSGRYVIVTSNKSFEEWVRSSPDNDDIEACRSRFFICHIETDSDGTHYLHCDSPASRGSSEVRLGLKARYIEFRDKFNDTIKCYKPSTIKVDYSDLNDRPISEWKPATEEELAVFEEVENEK